MSFEGVLRQQMGILEFYPKFYKHYKDLNLVIGLNAYTGEYVYVRFSNGKIDVGSWYTRDYWEQACDGTIEMPLEIFLGTTWGKYSKSQLLKWMITGKIKVRGLESLKKFMKIMSLITEKHRRD